MCTIWKSKMCSNNHNTAVQHYSIYNDDQYHSFYHDVHNDHNDHLHAFYNDVYDPIYYDTYNDVDYSIHDNDNNAHDYDFNNHLDNYTNPTTVQMPWNRKL